MPRYRSLVRSDEQKRNLKVDLRRIPEWEEEIESIRNCFRRFDLHLIISAASLIHETIGVLFLGYFSRYNCDQMEEQEKFDRWKSFLTIDCLIGLCDDYSAPQFLRYRMVEKEVVYGAKEIVEKIQSRLEEIEVFFNKCREKGVTNNGWVSLFTSKIDVTDVQMMEREKAKYLALSCKIPRIENAFKLFAEVRSESLQYASRVAQIKELLSLAKEKKEAIERFEAKHGNAFAKAAAADNQTRSRAASLKRLVKKTKECPYCGADLGVNPHMDHIYPVSKGGLSIVENLVWCCSICNGLKADKGLIQFLMVRGVPIEQVLSRLHSLGKHV
jgi:5-methylcytosine-specific restriction endonuclease McrA